MKQLSKIFAIIIIAFLLFNSSSFAQDAVKADPKHYKVEFENDQVRVLRFNYGPGEKSIMHSHPEGIVIILSDGETRFAFPDGTTQDVKTKAGQVFWSPKTIHQPEQLGDKPVEGYVIEMKKKN